VQVEVLVPSWVQADRVQLFANGIMIQESRLDQRAKNPAKDNPTARTISWTLSRPAHDVFLVAVASGPGVTAPYWPIARPYQPTSRAWDPPVIGATNPIWLDADGDGKFRSARDYAKNLLSRFGSDPARFLLELAKYDEAICVQAASLCQSAGRDIRAEEFVFGLKTSSDSVRHAFARYTATLP
jgi:hypothetical protein